MLGATYDLLSWCDKRFLASKYFGLDNSEIKKKKKQRKIKIKIAIEIVIVVKGEKISIF